MSESKIIIALDMDNQENARQFLKSVTPQVCRIKIGKEMFTAFGPSWVKEVVSMGFDVFLDLKFHDIPNTVYKAITQAAKLGVWMVNVHALGGKAMLEAAKKAIDDLAIDTPPLLIGVSILTSMDDNDIQQVGLSGTVAQNVLTLSELCYHAGLDGMVCSAFEASQIKERTNTQFLCVTPGIRIDNNKGDQKRVMSPKEAINAGADYLVIGRAITQSINPLETLENISHGI